MLLWDKLELSSRILDYLTTTALWGTRLVVGLGCLQYGGAAGNHLGSFFSSPSTLQTLSTSLTTAPCSSSLMTLPVGLIRDEGDTETVQRTDPGLCGPMPPDLRPD